MADVAPSTAFQLSRYGGVSGRTLASNDAAASIKQATQAVTQASLFLQQCARPMPFAHVDTSVKDLIEAINTLQREYMAASKATSPLDELTVESRWLRAYLRHPISQKLVKSFSNSLKAILRSNAGDQRDKERIAALLSLSNEGVRLWSIAFSPSEWDRMPKERFYSCLRLVRKWEIRKVGLNWNRAILDAERRIRRGRPMLQTLGVALHGPLLPSTAFSDSQLVYHAQVEHLENIVSAFVRSVTHSPHAAIELVIPSKAEPAYFKLVVGRAIAFDFANSKGLKVALVRGG